MFRSREQLIEASEDGLKILLGGNPDIDAIAPLQCKRKNDTPLLTMADGKTQIEVDGRPFQVETAHFGCTLIRTEAIVKTEKPWFKSEPDKDGGWGEGRIDDDIWFWRQWKKAGNTVYVAPDVRVGHLQLMVEDFDETMQPRVRTVDDWRNEHKPGTVEPA